MGRTKHGKDSARAKACAKYKVEGRRIINKQERQRKLLLVRRLSLTRHLRHLI